MLDADDVAVVIAGGGARRWLGQQTQAQAVRDRDIRHLRQFWVDPQRPQPSALAILQALDADLQAGFAVAGYWSYELGAALERTPRRGPLPDAAWLTFAPGALQAVALPEAVVAAEDVTLPADLLRQERAFLRSAADVAERIAAGEVYQVNLTAEFSVAMPRPQLLAAVAAVRQAQSVPYAAAMRLGDVVLISGSMERFLRAQGGTVSSRPIKGTTARGRDATEDAARRAQLANQPKELAENTMIVDMVRNDLQRACEVGSVRVPTLLHCEPYATLWHLESEVHGTLQEPGHLAPLLAATMPPASVTGCPKIQAMEVLDHLEQRPRSVYCGALGLAWPDGSADLAVAIRTMWWHAGRAHTAVGAGLVADSVAQAEWQETCLKARSALRTLQALGARWT